MAEKKKRNYNYVLVFTQHGPKFVTGFAEGGKRAELDGVEPMEFELEDARHTALRMTVNGSHAVAVTSLFRVEDQFYPYGSGHFRWVKNKEA